ncbi:putative signal peptide and transmembrane protein [Rhodopirellula islandica]|uniref:Signal peptide and transmembrane protein n=2 Tax=Rhodopirellula islandica TaxID=595434 RepID=A0A0J1BDL1_RHOIS|nr:putative signal peptide and transmembrane protein [Rhodopirellula islandica]
MHSSLSIRSIAFLATWVVLSLLNTPVAFAAETEAETDADNPAIVANFLGKYCLECHDKASAEGEREFESFSLPISSEQQLITTDEIIDQVTLRLMPPEESDQPTDEERLDLLEVLRDGITDARDQFKGHAGRTVMRRLSNREYEVTLAALFGRRVDTLGLTADFPKENTSHHLDTIGESLVTSGFLLDQYFQAASRLVETRLGKPTMEPKSWHFTDNFQQYEELTGAHRAVFKFQYLCLYEQPNTDTRQGGYGHIEDFLEGVPVSGFYDIEVNAQAMHRDTHYDPKIYRIDLSEPFQIAVVPGDATKGHIHYPQAIEPILASAVVPDEQPEWLPFRVWLEAGQTPRFIFPNGPYESRASVIETNRRYKDEFKNPKEGVSRTTLLREGKLPHIRIGEIKVRGPVEELHGSEEERAVFGSEGFQEDHALEQLFAFGQRAYRRTLEQADRDRIVAIYEKRLSENATPRQAALDTLKMILCSPSFLYLSEITPEEEPLLRPFDLASRLSYAMWAAPPDEELFEEAQSGRLTEPAVLKKQVQRMLRSERSNEFVNGFLDSWLNLRDIGNLPPPRKSVPDYYAENLPESMKQETRLFFRNLLDENGPVTDLLDADYSFVDKKLAKLYGLPEKETLRLADGFQRVSLAENRQRGGVLGMAGVLTVSANGVDTSPVTRGVWVLENILGTVPPPPPDEVPAIDANTSGATTIRDRLEKHREDKACAVCHRNIDPLGYALETFDPIGRWRSKYPKAKGKGIAAKVDATGKFPSGEEFTNFSDFKQKLLESRQDQFTRSLIEKLLAYSTGRHMERADQYEIDDIWERVQADGGGLQTMVTEVLTSDLFRSR